MKLSVGRILTAAGVVVAVAGVIAMAIGLKLSSDGFFQNVVMYKGIFAAAAGLMIVGAFSGRREKQKNREALRAHESAHLSSSRLEQAIQRDADVVNIRRPDR
jgi:hypothetical protein